MYNYKRFGTDVEKLANDIWDRLPSITSSNFPNSLLDKTSRLSDDDIKSIMDVIEGPPVPKRPLLSEDDIKLFESIDKDESKKPLPIYARKRTRR